MEKNTDRLAEILKTLDREKFAAAIDECWEVIGDERLVAHIKGELRRFSDAEKRGECLQLDELSYMAFIAMLDRALFDKPIGFDRERGLNLFRAIKARNN